MSNDDHNKNDRAAKKSGPIRKPRLPAAGQRPRKHREVQLYNALLEEARRDRAAKNLPPDEDACRAIAARELKRRKNWTRTPSGKDLGYRLEPSRVADYPEIVRVKALRESPVGQQLGAILRSRGRVGRPSEHNLAIAILEMLLWSSENLTIRDCYRRFTEAQNQALPYVYGEDCRDLAAYTTVCDAIGGATRKDGSRRPGLCDLITSDFIDRALVEVAKQFAPYAGEGFDIAASIDGTLIRAAADQRQGFSNEDEAHIDRGRGTAFGTHGDEFVRGYLAVALNLSSCNIPIAVKVMPATGYEVDTTVPLIERVHELWEDLSISYLVGDAAFERSWRTHRDLQQRYGTTIVAPRFDAKKSPAHLRGRGFEEGVPVCACSGRREKMALQRSEGFWSPQKRRDLGLRPGEDSTELKRAKNVAMRVCFECQRCGNGESLSVTQTINDEQPNFRWASHIPHHPIHEKRYALRQELMAGRNSVESMWNAMKKPGVDTSGPMIARWPRTEHQNHLFIKMKLLRFSLLKLLELDGTLARVQEQCIQDGQLLVPGTVLVPPGDLAA